MGPGTAISSGFSAISPIEGHEALAVATVGAIARLALCHEPIADDEGKLDIGGARWDVLGPDLAKGTKVRVIAVEGMKLRVCEA